MCRHFQHGFCKYADRCKYNHIGDICETSSCENIKYTSKDPKKCRYSHMYNNCKFGERRQFKRRSFEEKNEELENVIESIQIRNDELE